MKKMILSLMSATLGCAAFAANCVSVQQISTDYTTRTIVFTLTWAGCNATNNHLNKAWCFIDFRTAGSTSWTRATLSGMPGVVNGTYAAGNAGGFYVTGSNGTSATVTVKLGNAPDKFDWCAFATDYPPNVSGHSGTTGTLTGAPSFVVNGNAIAGNRFTGTLNTLTDATGCPGCTGRDVPTNAAVPCCSNLTAIGGYCRNLPADNATIVSGIDAEVKLNMGGGCTAMGWRYPTTTEALTLHSRGWYITSTSNDGRYQAYCVHYAPNCSYCTFTGGVTNGYKCDFTGCQTWGICWVDDYSRCIR